MTSSLSGLSLDAGQIPRLWVRPPQTETYGDLAATLSSSYGLKPDPWQQLVLDDWLSHAGDRWAASVCGLSMPRQNGKNGVLEIRELFGAVGLGEKILHTAHEVKTAQKHFRRLKHFFGSKVRDPKAKFPELNALVVELRSVNGQEAIYLSNGGSIEIVARSKGSARGFTNDVIVCDEAQDMSDEDLEALGPATSAAPLGDPQKIYTGTPPGPKVNGEVFTRIRTGALPGKEARRSWHEWSADSGVDIDDRAIWVEVNPGLITGRVLWSEVEDERGQLSEQGFSRERLGMWSEEGSRAVIDPVTWRKLVDHTYVKAGPEAYAIDVSPNRSRASIAMAGWHANGKRFVEWVDGRNSADWVVAAATQIHRKNQPRCWVIDGGSPAGSYIQALQAARVPVEVVGAREYAAACGKFYDEAMAGLLMHLDQPTLNFALSVARKRAIGSEGAWGWHRLHSEADITPVVAVTLAIHGLGVDMKIKRPSTLHSF